jgi:hypothetical protein
MESSLSGDPSTLRESASSGKEQRATGTTGEVQKRQCVYDLQPTAEPNLPHHLVHIELD